MGYETLYFAIAGICIFFMVFYFGRKNKLMFRISFLVLLISTIISITLYAWNVAMIDVAVVYIFIVSCLGGCYVMRDIVLLIEADTEEQKKIMINDKK